MKIYSVEVEETHVYLYVDSVDVRQGRKVSVVMADGSSLLNGTFIVADVDTNEGYVKVINRKMSKIIPGKNGGNLVGINLPKQDMVGSLSVI